MRVASLHRFPVKSVRGEELDVARVTERGLLGDRAYAVVDAEDGTVASAKHPRKWGALLRLSARFVAEPVLGEPLPPVVVVLPDGRELRSDDPATDAALSAHLGRAVRLTSEVPAGARFEEQWPAIEGLAPQGFIDGTTTSHEDGDPVSALDLGMLAPRGTFFDLAPLHVLTTSTLAHLGGLEDADFDVRRYRPNLLVEDAGPGFAEDAWVGRRARAGEVEVDVRMLAMRCVMTTLAQEGGVPEDRGTLRAIARHHRREIPGLGTWACAGVYGDVATSGLVRRGDEVVLLQP